MWLQTVWQKITRLPSKRPANSVEFFVRLKFHLDKQHGPNVTCFILFILGNAILSQFMVKGSQIRVFYLFFFYDNTAPGGSTGLNSCLLILL